MNCFINLFNHGTAYLRVSAMGAMALAAQFSLAQKTFLTGQKTGNYTLFHYSPLDPLC